MLHFIHKNEAIHTALAAETSDKEGWVTVSELWGALHLYDQTSALLLTLLLKYYLKMFSFPIRKDIISRNRLVYLCLAPYSDSSETSSICWTGFSYFWTPRWKKNESHSRHGKFWKCFKNNCGHWPISLSDVRGYFYTYIFTADGARPAYVSAQLHVLVCPIALQCDTSGKRGFILPGLLFKWRIMFMCQANKWNKPEWSVNAAAPEKMWSGHLKTPGRERAALELLKH